MATLTIRDLDDATKAQLRLQAARHGLSMEEAKGHGSRIQAHFAHLGGVELELPYRTSIAQPAAFEGGEASA